MPTSRERFKFLCGLANIRRQVFAVFRIVVFTRNEFHKITHVWRKIKQFCDLLKEDPPNGAFFILAFAPNHGDNEGGLISGCAIRPPKLADLAISSTTAKHRIVAPIIVQAGRMRVLREQNSPATEKAASANMPVTAWSALSSCAWRSCCCCFVGESGGRFSAARSPVNRTSMATAKSATLS